MYSPITRVLCVLLCSLWTTLALPAAPDAPPLLGLWQFDAAPTLQAKQREGYRDDEIQRLAQQYAREHSFLEITPSALTISMGGMTQTYPYYRIVDVQKTCFTVIFGKQKWRNVFCVSGDELTYRDGDDANKLVRIFKKSPQ